MKKKIKSWKVILDYKLQKRLRKIRKWKRNLKVNRAKRKLRRIEGYIKNLYKFADYLETKKPRNIPTGRGNEMERVYKKAGLHFDRDVNAVYAQILDLTCDYDSQDYYKNRF